MPKMSFTNASGLEASAQMCTRNNINRLTSSSSSSRTETAVVADAGRMAAAIRQLVLCEACKQRCISSSSKAQAAGLVEGVNWSYRLGWQNSRLHRAALVRRLVALRVLAPAALVLPAQTVLPLLLLRAVMAQQKPCRWTQ
jgi:hypothetical protein